MVVIVLDDRNGVLRISFVFKFICVCVSEGSSIANK